MSTAYELAREAYAAEGIDTEAVLAKLAGKAISVNCWQGDDVMGFDQKDNAASGGIMTTGNYPGRARTFEELTADFEKACSLIPGKKRINLHASYAIFTDENPWVDRDQIEYKHFEPWVAWAKEHGYGIDFNPTLFSHPMVKEGLTVSSPDKDVRDRKPAALEKVTAELRDEVDFRIFLQYIFFKQWTALREYANEKGIQIIGDIPIYVSADSSDVWTHPKLFKLKPDRSPKLVAGVPPDYYSATGQLWGNPVYNWTAHKAENYAWWIWRMKSNMALFDVVRLDHFRGFAAYWEVGADEETAINGKWRKGPGMELFNAIEKALGPVPLIAEDLGVQTDEVKKLLEESGFPGMRVLIFGFTPDYDNEHLPHNYKPNSIVYTSTHDSQTVCEQIMDICSEPEKQFAYRYLRTSHAEAMGWSAIKCVWASSANIAMTTLQDLLSLGADSRMNTPATIGGKNWRWRVRAEALNPTVSSMLGEITKTYMRG